MTVGVVGTDLDSIEVLDVLADLERMFQILRDFLDEADRNTVVAVGLARAEGLRGKEVDYRRGTRDTAAILGEDVMAALRVFAIEMEGIDHYDIRSAAEAARDVLTQIDRRGMDVRRELAGVRPLSRPSGDA